MNPESHEAFNDSAIQQLDGAFDWNGVVIFHGLAGAGKTSTAREFSAWYADTGGTDTAPLFTSFEAPRPFASVLEEFLLAIGQPPTGRDPRQRALDALRARKYFWVWDNVETIAGFPGAEDAELSLEEQRELAAFVQEAGSTGSKLLLTSRRTEEGWLGEWPKLVRIPALRTEESWELLRGLLAKSNLPEPDWRVWEPVVQFAEGNPLTLISLAGSLLASGAVSEREVQAALATGVAPGLYGALAYGFEHAFATKERAKLSILHLFEGVVEPGILVSLGDPRYLGEPLAFRGICLEEWDQLLRRGASIGLLEDRGDRWTLHPALPSFLREHFERHYDSRQQLVCWRLFTGVLTEFAARLKVARRAGSGPLLDQIATQERNMLRAQRMAVSQQWWREAIDLSQMLALLYGARERHAPLRRLFAPMEHQFEDSEGNPNAGQEYFWQVIMQYRLGMAQQDSQWDEAERLRGACARLASEDCRRGRAD